MENDKCWVALTLCARGRGVACIIKWISSSAWSDLTILNRTYTWSLSSYNIIPRTSAPLVVGTKSTLPAAPEMDKSKCAKTINFRRKLPHRSEIPRQPELRMFNSGWLNYPTAAINTGSLKAHSLSAADSFATLARYQFRRSLFLVRQGWEGGGFGGDLAGPKHLPPWRATVDSVAVGGRHTLARRPATTKSTEKNCSRDKLSMEYSIKIPDSVDPIMRNPNQLADNALMSGQICPTT
ncbi:hypothetical protein J6590_077458 [Homalodisca vitripennis]|nr:hypothetical protein J6590_077458 [Homalodisca vitripennis]